MKIVKTTLVSVALAGALVSSSFAAGKFVPKAADFVEPVAQYKLYVLGEIEKLVSGTKSFVEALKAGKLEDAKMIYAPVRLYYESTEPAAEMFGDLDPAIDAREDDFKKKHEDPNWTGFHKLERIMWHDKTTKGTTKLADDLLANVLDLQKRIKNEKIPVVTMVQGAADLMEEIATSKITGEEDRYSRTDLYDFYANLVGSQKIVNLLRPLIEKANPTLMKNLDKHFAELEDTLNKYRTYAGGFKSYEAVTKKDKTVFKAQVAQLSEELATLRGTLGLAN